MGIKTNKQGNILIFQLAVAMASSSEDSVSSVVYVTVLKGLERLLLTDVLTAQDADIIVKLSVDRWVQQNTDDLKPCFLIL